jgi:hypothetical protein
MNTAHRAPIILASALAISLAAAPAVAQATRREAIEQQRSARAAQLKPYEPGRVESALTYIERNRLIERLSGRDGFYPRIGSIQRGGGMALGIGYHRPWADRRVVFDVSGAATVRGYFLGAADLSMPRLVSDRLTLAAHGRYRYFPQEDYFGLGPASVKADRANYLLEETEFGTRASLRPLPWFTWTAKAAYRTPRIAAGTDSQYPAVGDVFTPATAPGLLEQPSFFETGSLFEIDSRDQPGNPRSGTYVAVVGARFTDLDDLGYDFSRVGGEVQHYIPIFDKKRVIAVRGAFNSYEPGRGNVVPFYYMLPLGGKDSIRGFADFRFRDLKAVLFNVEYRWEAVGGVDMALFYDVGDARPEWRALTWGGLKQSYGIGFRFNTYKSIFLRTEIAFGSGEGTRTIVAFGAPLRLERYLR